MFAFKITCLIGLLCTNARVADHAFAQSLPEHAPCVNRESDCEERPSVFIEQPTGSVKVGADTVPVGEPRYPRRSIPADGMLVVEFSETPETTIASNAVAPNLGALVGRPDLQRAFDEQAKPGEFVTPPSIGM